ncbi:TerD family protein [Corynebacterium aquatimens]|uniref:TerD domain-containing protein n=1 Tax=Corynebacterium aquatimens TaxID=1190508 RepID=A0A931E1Q2_9CORY|nr:TerD family protein [Corynebacterium aquatimens]MBG6121736.1 hypothetical protein [Corynebacterium aquatimens]WJY65725.1 hypothetical protein CAQUA_05085 [Corynebacterium aquatimens]
MHDHPGVSTTLTMDEPAVQYRVAELALRRRNLLYLFPGQSDQATVEKFLGDMALLGYRVEDDQLPLIATADPRSLGVVVDRAREITGFNSAHLPTLNPDFRNTVPGLTESQLYARALAHYFYRGLGIQWLSPAPPEGVLAGTPLENRTPRPVRIATDADIAEIAASLIASSQPFSTTDADDIRALGAFIPQAVDVPIRENLALLAAHRVGGLDWAPLLKTPTDVLRVASELSGGDRSLGINTKFKLRRADRRFVVKLLEPLLSDENLHYIQAEEERWKRLMRALHPQEYPWAERVNEVRAMVHGPRHAWPKAHEWQIEDAVARRDHETLQALFAANPGDFARRLHALWRAMPADRDWLTAQFRHHAPDVSARVLVQMWNFFNSARSDELPYRVVMPKRSGSQAMYVLNTLAPGEDYTPIIEAIEHGLHGRLAGRRFRIETDMAHVVGGDPAARVTIPLGVRSASSGTRTVGRGTRIPVGDGAELRFFLHWRGQFVDLDLTAYFTNEDGSKLNAISYTNLRDDETRSFHSGDITHAPEGAAEYIQLHVASLLAEGYRYVVLNCFSYSRTLFANVEDAQIGILGGANLSTGQDFEASEVVARIDLTTPSFHATPAVVDLARRELIWLDWTVPVSDQVPVNVESTYNEIQLLLDNARHSAYMDVATYLRLAGADITDSPDAKALDPFHTEAILALLS